MSFATWAWMAAFWIAGFVVLSLLVALVLPRYLRVTAAPSGRGLGKALLVGLLTVLAAGPAMLILFITFVGALGALLLHAALTVGLMVGAVLTAYFIGRTILHTRATNTVGATALGAALLAVVGVVPVAGPIIVFLAACAGLGMIVLGLRSQREPRAVGAYPGPTGQPSAYPGAAYPGAAYPAAAYHPGPTHPAQPGPNQPTPPQDGSTRTMPVQPGPTADRPTPDESTQTLPTPDGPADQTRKPE